MFDSPTSHQQVFAGFGHQSAGDSFGTIRKHQMGGRISVMANAKRIYDEVSTGTFRSDLSLNPLSLGADGEESENLSEQCRNHRR